MFWSVLLWSITCLSISAQLDLSINPASSNLSVGEEMLFVVQVNDGFTDLVGVEFTVSFDESRLEYVDASVLDTSNSDISLNYFPPPGSPSVGPGVKISFYDFNLSGVSMPDGSDFLSITLRATAPGTASIEIICEPSRPCEAINDQFIDIGINSSTSATVNIGSGSGCWTLAGPTTSNTLNDIYVSQDNSKIWICGSSEQIIQSFDGGNGWSIKGGGSNTLYSVHGNNSGLGCAVGLGGTVLITKNGGISWLNYGDAGSGALYGVSVLENGYIWTVGQGGNAYRTKSKNGTSWDPYGKINTGGIHLRDVYFLDNNVGWAVGDDGSVFSTDEGSNPNLSTLDWYKKDIGISPNSDLRSVFFLDQYSGWIVGYSLVQNVYKGVIYKTENGGLSWESQEFSSPTSFQDVYFISEDSGIVVGWDGSIFRTNNGGADWVEEYSGVSEPLFGVSYAGNSQVWAVGSSGTILKTGNMGSVSINASSPCEGETLFLSVGGINGSYIWEGPNNFTSNISDPSISNVSTLASGLYSVSISDGGCMTTGTINISIKPKPDVKAMGGVLDCNTGSIQLQGVSNTPGVTFSWVGPNSFSSTLQNPFVSVEGEYVLTVASPNGCTRSMVTQVTSDGSLPSAELTSPNGLEVTCANTSVLLQGESNQNATFNWYLNGSPVGAGASISVSMGGTYLLVVTSAVNGCTNTQSVDVVENIEPPMIQDIQGGTIDCLSGSLSLSVSASPSNVTFQWAGPNGFQSNMKTPIVSVPGVYTVTVTRENGCTVQQSVEVDQSSDVPENVQVSYTDILDCNHPSTQVQVSSTTSGVLYSWSGPGGYTSSTAINTVSIPGIYYVTVTDPVNHCIVQGQIDVLQDISVLDIEGIVTVNSDCDAGTITKKAEFGSVPLSVEWLDENGLVVSENNEIVISEAGSYRIYVTGYNGCVAEQLIIISQSDLPLPIVYSVKKDVIDCETGQSLLTVEATTYFDSIVWYDPNGSLAGMGGSFTALQSGSYHLVITNTDGCQSEMDIFIESAGGGLLPTVITPNGDGYNDRLTFRPCNSQAGSSVKLRVFNRWGGILFESQDYQNDWPNADQSILPSGLYFYIVELSGIQIRRNLSVLRGRN